MPYVYTRLWPFPWPLQLTMKIPLLFKPMWANSIHTTPNIMVKACNVFILIRTALPVKYRAV